jgi:AcrR family transcriptional regulator
MASASQTRLTARKTPRQARATVTLEAILEATIQVLVATGPTRLTTTRVAERAGVSVGTMYQYFPNKQALLYAVTERYLDIVADSLEQACRPQHGAPVGQMAETLVEAYWHAKVVRCKVTRAMHLVAAEVDTTPLVEEFSKRVEIATARCSPALPTPSSPIWRSSTSRSSLRFSGPSAACLIAACRSRGRAAFNNSSSSCAARTWTLRKRIPKL